MKKKKMQRLIFLCAILSSVLTFSLSSANATEEVATTLKQPQFAKLYSEQEKIPEGDLIKLQRQIGNWDLECLISASKRRRICRTEQYIRQDDNWIKWSIGVATDGKTYVLVNAPSSIDTKDGIRITFSGLEKTLKDITCDAGSCTTSFPLEGFVQSAIMSSETITFSYRKEKNIVTLSNNMAGLLYAIDAAGNNPLADIINEDNTSENKSVQEKKLNNKNKKNNK